MSNDDPAGDVRFGTWLLDDAKARLQYQHEYTLAGLKTLILINGGAIIGLLTYAGNAASAAKAAAIGDQLGVSFVGYVVGLALAVFAYLGAYFSQAQFMQYSTLQAGRVLGVPLETNRTAKSYETVGTWAVRLAVLLAVFSLVSFGVGSRYALRAVSNHTEGQRSGAARPTNWQPAPAGHASLQR